MKTGHLLLLLSSFALTLGSPSLGQHTSSTDQVGFFKAAQKTPNVQTQVTTGLVQSILEPTTKVLYHGTTLGKCNILFRKDSITFAAAASEMGPAGNFPLRFPNAQTRQVSAKAPTGGVTNIFHGNRSWLGLANYGALGYERLFPGIDASFRADARRLKQTFQVDAHADLSALVWAFPGARVSYRQDGHLRISQNGRDLVLGGLTATQGTNHLKAQWSFTGNRVAVALSNYRKDLPLLLEASLVFDAYFDDFATHQVEQSTYLTGNTASLFDAVTKPTSDLFVAELSPDQDVTRFMTIIGGKGDDAGTALFVSNNDRLYVSGHSTSHDLPVTHGTHHGKRDAFVLCLNGDGTQIGSGLFFGGQDDDDAQVILQQADGTLFVAGETASSNFPRLIASPDFKTIFPRFPLRKPTRYFAAEIDHQLSGLQTSAVVTGPKLHLPLVAAIVDKVPCFGLQDLANSRGDEVCYTMNEYFEDYTAVSDKVHQGFGYYALLWKKYRVIGTHVYSPSAAQSTGTVPIDFNSFTFYSQAGTLNDLENNASVFSPNDPGGTWQYDTLLSASDRILANIFWLSRWKTPIFTEQAFGTSTTEDVAIREMCVEGTNPLYPEVGDLCDLTVDLFADITCTGTLLSNFTLHSWKVARWTTSTYIPDEEILWPLGSYPFLQSYIYDPPVGDEAAVPLILEAVRQLRQRIATMQTVDIVDYRQGRLAKSSTAEWLVKVAAIYP